MHPDWSHATTDLYLALVFVEVRWMFVLRKHGSRIGVPEPLNMWHAHVHKHKRKKVCSRYYEFVTEQLTSCVVYCRPVASNPTTQHISSFVSAVTPVHRMGYSSEISPRRCNNCVFILRSGFNLHVSGDNLTHHQEYICCIWPQVSRLT